MTDKETQLTILLLFFIVAGALYWFFDQIGGSISAPPAKNSSVDSSSDSGKKSSPCGQVIKASCNIQLKRSSSECDKLVIQKSLTSQLANPLDHEECETAHLSLSERCPEKCIFDYGSVVTVPGRIQFDYFPKTEQDPQCYARAKRVVGMQGRCVEKSMRR